MKRLFLSSALIVLFLISFIYTNVKSQSLGLGIEAGINIANVSLTPTATTSTRTGIMIGAVLDIGFSPNLGVTTGLRYNQKGYSYINLFGQSVTVKASYLEFPALLKVKFPLTEIKPYLIGGPILGINLAATQETGTTNTGSTDISAETESIDFGLLFGAGMDFKVGPKLNLFIQPAYGLGLSNAKKGSINETIKHNGFQITGGVKFVL